MTTNNPETLRAPFDARTLQAVIDLLDRVVMVAAPSAEHPGDREVIAYVGGLSSARNYVSGMLDASLRRAMEQPAAVDLNDYRKRKAAARAYHPSAWTPRDAIKTAEDFHADIANAERGVAVEPHLGIVDSAPWCISWSRARKAKWHNRFAVALLLVTFAFLGAVVYAASARADDDTDAWQWEYGPAVCSFLDDPENHNLLGLSAAIAGAEQMGLTPYQAGEAVAASVLDICPRHRDLLRQFVQKYGPKKVA